MSDPSDRHRSSARNALQRWHGIALPVIATCAALFVAGVKAHDITVYRGMCDASAAVALDARHFVVASDEDNTLRIFERGRPQAVGALPLAGFLGTGGESDLEGAAKVGSRIYWISSHGRNSGAKERPDRYRFFVTEVDASTSPPSLKPVAAPRANLLPQLLAADALQGWHLADAARRAPEAPGGLNIEGLAATPEGPLLIGFRNPVRDGKALVVPLRNPQEVASGGAASFGAPMAWDLGGRGVRSLERLATDFLVVAGPTADQGDFALFRWSGKPADAPQRMTDMAFGTLRPEALFAWPHDGVVQVLSDDGGVAAGGIACKDRPSGEQSFRSIDFKP